MLDIRNTQLSVDEILSAIGVTQCIFIIVYMAFRAGSLARASIAFSFFMLLAVGFYIDLSERFIEGITPYYDFVRWLVWYSIPPLSILLTVQISVIKEPPALKFYLYLLPVPIIVAISHLLMVGDNVCSVLYVCQEHLEWLKILSVVLLSLTLLSVWFITDIFHFKRTDSYKLATKERFWLITSIFILNTALIALLLLELTEVIAPKDAQLVKTVVGIGFAYLASTSLFRIYPQAVEIIDIEQNSGMLTAEDKSLALVIDKLLSLEKVYQEPSYGRGDLARELGVTEARISKIVSLHYNIGVPQLLNEYRVCEAKHLLIETDENIKTIAIETGFNSMPSFNRVFKQTVGISASEYRKTSR